MAKNRLIKTSILTIAILFVSVAPLFAITWNLYNGDAQSFPTVGAGHSNVTEEGKNCVLLDANGDYFSNTSIAWTSDLTIEITAKWASGTQPFSDGQISVWYIYARDSSKYSATAHIGRLYTRDNGVRQIYVVGNNLGPVCGFIDASYEWHTLRLVIKNKIGHLFVDGYYQGSNSSEGLSTYSANTVGFQMQLAGGQTGNLFINTIKISSEAEEPTSFGGITIQGEKIATRLFQDIPSGLINANATALVYARKDRPLGDVNYGVELVPTNDALASKVRISKGGAIYALQKYPTF